MLYYLKIAFKTDFLSKDWVVDVDGRESGEQAANTRKGRKQKRKQPLTLMELVDGESCFSCTNGISSIIGRSRDTRNVFFFFFYPTLLFLLNILMIAQTATCKRGFLRTKCLLPIFINSTLPWLMCVDLSRGHTINDVSRSRWGRLVRVARGGGYLFVFGV